MADKPTWYNGKYFLTLVSASIFLVLVGMISHDAFADTVGTSISGVVPNFINVNPNTNMVYADNSTTFFVINGSTNTVTNTISFGNSAHLAGIGINPITNEIYVADTSARAIHVINGNTNSIIANITFSFNISISPTSKIIVNSNTNKIYLDYGYLAVINASNNQVLYGRGDCDYPDSGFGIDTVTNKIYEPCNYQPNPPQSPARQTYVTVFNSSDAEVSRINIALNGTLGDIGVDSKTNTIYQTQWDSNVVYVFDGNTNTLIDTVPATVSGKSIDVNSDTNKIYAIGVSNKIVVIDGSTNKVIQSIQMSSSPSQIAVNPTTNKIYVANGDSVLVIDGSSSNTSTTTPSVPQNLQSTSGNSQVTLSWTAPSSNGGSTITGYNLYRGTTSGAESSTPIATGISSTSYSDTTVTNGQTYFYKVTAVNSVGESAPSNEASATPTAPTTVSSAPTGLTATTTSSSQINLSWTTPSSNGGSSITGYMIERSNNTGTTWSTIQSNTGSTATTYSDTGLAPSTTYTYRVSAINSVGTSPPSNATSATTSAVTPPPPTGITFNNIQSTSGTVSSSNQMTLANFDSGTGNNKLLVVGISADSSDVNSITFNGMSLTRKAGSFYNNDAEFWYLKNPSGTGDIVVTMNGQTSAVVGAYSFSGVNQTTPLPTSTTKHNTNPNSPNITITTKFANDWVLDLPSIYGGSTLGSPTCTQQWDANLLGSITGASSSKIVPTPGAVTCKWTASSGDLWDDAAIEIKASK